LSRAKRIALVGAGHIAETHARAIREVGARASFVAVAELEPTALDSFANRHGIPGRYGDLATLIAAEAPDLVVVCTPPWLHFEQIRTCLAAGSWVLCEKPAAGSLAELDAIEAAERTSGARCSSVFQWRFGDQVVIDDGLVNGSARTVGWLGSVMRYAQSGYLYHYAFAMILGLASLLMWLIWRT